MTDEILERLGDAYVAVLSDALDSLGLREQALDPAIRPAYPGARLAGRALPLLLHETDTLLEEPYESPASTARVPTSSRARACARSGRSTARSEQRRYARPAQRDS